MAPALAPRSGAKTSILTGLARWAAPVELADDVLALTADVTATVPPITTATVAAATIRLFFFMWHVLCLAIWSASRRPTVSGPAHVRQFGRRLRYAPPSRPPRAPAPAALRSVVLCYLLLHQTKASQVKTASSRPPLPVNRPGWVTFCSRSPPAA